MASLVHGRLGCLLRMFGLGPLVGHIIKIVIIIMRRGLWKTCRPSHRLLLHLFLLLDRLLQSLRLPLLLLGLEPGQLVCSFLQMQ